MRKFNEIKLFTQKAISTGIVELDQFLSFEGGIPLGHLLFFTASPGAGKTSLSVLIMRNITNHKTALLEREVSAELLAKQVQNIDVSKNHNCYIEDKMSIHLNKKTITVKEAFWSNDKEPVQSFKEVEVITDFEEK